MGKRLLNPKDTVRIRSKGCCEKCGVELTKNVNGVPDADTARSIHHRQPVRCGGRDSVPNLINLCIKCHRWIHKHERKAQRMGWILLNGNDPSTTPFLSWQGMVLPDRFGGLTLLNFETGHTEEIPFPGRQDYDVEQRPRRRYATRPQYDRRKKSRRIARFS